MAKPLHLYGLLLVLALLWGSAFLFIKLAVASVDPAPAAFMRILIGALAVGALCLVRRVSAPGKAAEWAKLSLLGLFGIALPFFLQNAAGQAIDSAEIAILMATTPLLTFVLAHLLVPGERLTLAAFIGLVLGLGGVVILVAPQGRGLFQMLDIGHVLALGAATCFAINIIVTRRIAGMHPMTMTLGALIWATLISGAFTLATTDPMAIEPTGISLLAIATLGLGATAAGAYLSIYLIQNLGPQTVALTIYLVPPIGILFGVLFLSESVTLTALGGTALILSGIFVATAPIPSAMAALRKIADEKLFPASAPR